MASAGKLATTAAVTALIVHIPCCLPPILIGLGSAATSGLAWLHALDPFRPYLIAFSMLTLTWGFWQAYQPVHACSCEGHTNADHAAERRVKIAVMWAVAAVVLIVNLIPHVH